jgi:hypothetical protein
LKQQIEVTLINNPAVWAHPNGSQRISEFSSIDSEVTANSEGSAPLGELLMHIEVNFTQGPEDFFPIPSISLDGFDAGVQMSAGTTEPGFSITFTNPIP